MQTFVLKNLKFLTLDTNINKRIKELINQLGESNNRFAQRVGTSSAVISHLVTGRNRPNIDLLYKIIRSLPNVSIEWLILGSKQVKIDPDKSLEEEPGQDQSFDDLAQENTSDFYSKQNYFPGNTNLQWPVFISMLQQMMESQKLAFQSMEQQISSQQQLLEWLKGGFDNDNTKNNDK